MPDSMVRQQEPAPFCWLAGTGQFVSQLRSWATQAYPDSWLIILGMIFLLVVLFLPGGIVSLPAKIMAWRSRRQPPVAPLAATKPAPDRP